MNYEEQRKLFCEFEQKYGGVELLKVYCSALAALLIDKGIITRSEFVDLGQCMLESRMKDDDS